MMAPVRPKPKCVAAVARQAERQLPALVNTGQRQADAEEQQRGMDQAVVKDGRL